MGMFQLEDVVHDRIVWHRLDCVYRSQQSDRINKTVFIKRNIRATLNTLVYHIGFK